MYKKPLLATTTLAAALMVGCSPEMAGPHDIITPEITTSEAPPLTHEMLLEEYRNVDLLTKVGQYALYPAEVDGYIARCFDEPTGGTVFELPKSAYSHPEASSILDDYQDELIQARNPSLISIPIVDNRPSTMPSVELTEQVEGSIVKITQDETDVHGSGVITTDGHGNHVVLTAAHIGAKMPLSEMVVTDTEGNSSRVESGCYVYESRDELGDLHNTIGSKNIDIAILRLESEIGSHALKLASTSADRGDWVRLTNFGADAALNSPRTFHGLVAEGQPFKELTIITDLCAYDSPDEAAQNYATCGYVGGGSGGVVTNGADEVVGISYAGMNYSDFYHDAEMLKDYYDLEFPGAEYGYESGFNPDPTSVVDVRTIKAILNKLP